MSILNFPYYIYPSTPCVEYKNTLEYNSELIRLNSEINKLESFNGIFHLTIGAAMEESFAVDSKWKDVKYDDCVTFQWQQLYPYHLHHFTNLNIPIIHFIVSPNESFSTEKFIEPAFIKKTPWMNWEKNNKTYISKTFKYIVMIFYTMMPTIDTRNQKFCVILKERLTDDTYKTFEQTPFDISFVITFYKQLEFVVRKIKLNGGVISCFSFAVFSASGLFARKFNNFTMFKEICDIFYDTNKKSLLAEWTFHDTCNSVSMYVKDDSYCLISYIVPKNKSDNDLHIVPLISNSNIYFDIRSVKFIQTVFDDCYIPEISQIREKIQQITNLLTTKRTHHLQINNDNINKSSDIILSFITTVSNVSFNINEQVNECIQWMFEIFNSDAIFLHICKLDWIKQLRKDHLANKDVIQFYISVKKIGINNNIDTSIIKEYKLDKKIFNPDCMMLLAISHMHNIMFKTMIGQNELIIAHPMVNNNNFILINEYFGNDVLYTE